MRYLNILLALLMLIFIAVQYNDPDGLIWMVIYLVPAFWALFAAAWPRRLNAVGVKALLLVCIGLAVAGTVYFWPRSDHWWSMDVWYSVETAREGMGMMIVTSVLAVVWWTARRVRERD